MRYQPEGHDLIGSLRNYSYLHLSGGFLVEIEVPCSELLSEQVLPPPPLIFKILDRIIKIYYKILDLFSIFEICGQYDQEHKSIIYV